MDWTKREEKALKAGLRELGLIPGGSDGGETDESGNEMLKKLNAYARELLLWNGTHSLVSLSNPLELVHRHILDSLAALPFIGKPATLADVGSGAGLPGIPLAIALPDTKVFLIEKMGRRCDFLRNVIAVTGLLGRVEVLQKSLEQCNASYDAVTLRAFAPLPRAMDGLFSITSPGGRIYAYKGRRDTIGEEIAAEWDVKIETLKVPGQKAERTLVIIGA